MQKRGEDGFHNNANIVLERDLFKISFVARQFVRQNLCSIKLLGISLTPKDLFFMAIYETCRVGDPGPCGQHQTLFWCIYFNIDRHLGPRTNKTHIPPEYIPKLG